MSSQIRIISPHFQIHKRSFFTTTLFLFHITDTLSSSIRKKLVRMHLSYPRKHLIKALKAKYHYWFALGIGLAFCIHQAEISLTKRTLTDDIEGGGLVSLSAQHTSRGESFDCDWYPDNTQDCETMLLSRLPLGSLEKNLAKRRWLFLGDSTMKRLFERSPLRAHLMLEPVNSLNKMKPHECWQGDERKGLICNQRFADRCKLNELFDLPYAKEWKHPDFRKFEGPLKYGLLNEFCTDCSGCKSNFLDCQIQDLGLADPDPSFLPCDRKRLTYGGYMTVEFARDVEIQTPKYSTTQENIAAYLQQAWNEPNSALVKEWGLPICVVNTGMHDAAIPGMTVPDFIRNVDWYLKIFQSQCAHFIWLSNTAPNQDMSNFPQTETLMRSYDLAVKEYIATTMPRSLRHMTSFINIFDSSMKWPHDDHIHMDNLWYHKLGQWFVNTLMV